MFLGEWLGILSWPPRVAITKYHKLGSLKPEKWTFPGGPVVKNPPINAGDAGSISAPEARSHMPQGQLSPCAATKIPRAAVNTQRSQK